MDQKIEIVIPSHSTLNTEAPTTLNTEIVPSHSTLNTEAPTTLNAETVTPHSTLNAETPPTTSKLWSLIKNIGGGIGSLIKLLPTGTVFLFQFLNPIFTNSGECKTSNKALTSILLVICAFNCLFSTFTDSYIGTDKKRHYGIVTIKGLYPSPVSDTIDLSKYRLRFGDIVQAAYSLLIFALLGLLDSNTVQCFYPSFESTRKKLLHALPPIIGVIVVLVFPRQRHGYGYPVATDDSRRDTAVYISSKSNT